MKTEMDSLPRASSGPLVSVILPIHNGFPFLMEAISSVLAQSHRDLELILVDDGSTDGCLDLIGLVADSRIRLVSQPHSGTAAARNHGIRLARGELLAFLDQDDLWLPEKLAVQVKTMACDPSLDLVLGQIWQGQFAAGRAPVECLKDASGIRRPGYLPSALLVRRTLLELMGGFREEHQLAESFEWFVRARDQGRRESMLQEVVVVRRVHPGNKSLSLSSLRSEYARVLLASLRLRRSAPAAGGADGITAHPFTFAADQRRSSSLLP